MLLIKLIISLGLILFNSAEIGGSDTKWIEGLKESVKSDRHIYQIVFIMDKSVNRSVNNPIFKEIIKKLSSNVPVYIIVLPNNAEPTKSDIVRCNPRISLFVITNSETDRKLQSLGNISEITQSFDFITQLSEAKRRPKCLLLLSRVRNYRPFFEALWREQYLDVTIIEIEKVLDHAKDDSANYRVFQYNPFLGSITNATASLETVWFPDKLKNLHGYPLIASLLHAPPDVFEQKGSRKLSGLGIKKLESLKQVLNFTIVISSINYWGKLTCSKIGSTGALGALYRNELQILGFESNIEICLAIGTVISKGFRENKIGLVVPLIKKNVNFTKNHWQLSNILVVMLLPIFFWILSRIMRFQKKEWKIDYLIRIVFGFVVPKEPEFASERVIFLTFIFLCFMFSSEIYTSITRAQLPTKSEFKFETLKDVLTSNLQIMIKENYFLMINDTDDTDLKGILQKSDLMVFSQDECVERLLKYKNLSCILEVTRAELFLRNRRDKCGQPLVKIFTEKFPSGPAATNLGAGVPYAKRFDQVLQRLIEFGVSKKWMEPYSVKKVSFSKIGRSCNSKQSESVLTIRQIAIVAFSGYFSSICIFILELLNYRLTRTSCQFIK